jgi:hypothetical protein
MCYRSLFLAVLAGVASGAAASPPILLTVNDFGDAGPGNCVATCTLRDALHDIADGGIINFASAPLPQTITLAQGSLIIVKSVTILGPGPAQLAISANKLSRVLGIQAQDGQHVLVAGVTLRDGKIVGTNGADGVNGASDSTVNGQSGGSVVGGCFSAGSTEPGPSSLSLEQVDVRECEAIGGDGGTGGTGSTGTGLATGGQGGAGGSGGSASGGGLFIGLCCLSSVTLRKLSVINATATGGNAGSGGDGGPAPFYRGKGGAGGAGGSGTGGAIYVTPEDTPEIYNATIADSEVTGGNGADGGDGDASLNTASGGNGGNGGFALGGLVAMQAVGNIGFTTLTHGGLTTGAPGNGGSGAVGGAPGQPGTASGIAIYSGGATAVATVIVGPVSASASLCSPGIAAKPGYVNLDEDGSCSGFTLHGNLAELFRPLDLSGTAWPAYMPRYGSKIIDAAACSDGTPQPPTDDQHGTTRPQGSQCDLGAIEADYVFVGVFD